MNCNTCGKPLANPKAKFCSGACKMKAHRASTPLNPPLKKAPKDKPEWQDTYEKCDGCDGRDCASGFKPNSPNPKEFLKAHKL